MPSLHQKERRADHGAVLAVRKNSRSLREVRMNGFEYAVFAAHIVGLWGYRSERRTPQNVLGSSRTNEINQIGVAVRELEDFNGSPKITAQPVGIELFSRPDRNRVTEHSNERSIRRRSRV
jgi:hypothetical protein